MSKYVQLKIFIFVFLGSSIPTRVEKFPTIYVPFSTLCPPFTTPYAPLSGLARKYQPTRWKYPGGSDSATKEQLLKITLECLRESSLLYPDNAILLENKEKALRYNESDFKKIDKLETECPYCGLIFNCSLKMDRHRDDDTMFCVDKKTLEKKNICGFCLQNVGELKKVKIRTKSFLMDDHYRKYHKEFDCPLCNSSIRCMVFHLSTVSHKLN
jgi:Zn finger protein HypA/HybF involved in hydrogenase expression